MEVQCCIVGGGPAGMMLGYLLARAGVEVVVLEKHADFLRDFRGDTVHPSTLELMYELGILDEFLRRPHQEIRQLRGWVGPVEMTVADFSHLPTHCQFAALMPQWDFLNFIAEKAKSYSSFHLIMEAEATDLIEEAGRVKGVRTLSPKGILDIHAELVVGADGRHSVIREKAGLKVDNLGAPIDVLWMRLSRKPTDPDQTFGRFDRGHIMVMLNRDTYWQCAYVIPKGSIEDLRQRSLPVFRQEIANAVPFLNDRLQELKSWDDVKLLTVVVDRLREWSKPGLLCIGDAAHAMSPVGGVGINLAIQDAVAAANILTGSLRDGRVDTDDLKKVQKRRLFPTQVTQKLQLYIQDHIISPSLEGESMTELPWALKLVSLWPVLTRLPARLIGVGIRPEHIHLDRQASVESRSRFAGRVFRWAGVYGLIALVPQYFMEQKISTESPVITHPEYFYGFIGVGVAWQVLFLVIARDPVRFRPVMPAGVLEKVAFGLAVWILSAQERVGFPVPLFACIDLILATLFILAYLKTPREDR